MPRVSQDHLDARRRQILAAARRCFLRSGFHATSMQQVLTEAGLSAGAVYRYFRSKDDIVLAIAEEAMQRLRTVLLDALHRDPPPPLDQLIGDAFDTLERMDEREQIAAVALQVWAEATYAPTFAGEVATLVAGVRDALTDVVATYQKRGELPDDVAAADLGRVLLSLLPGFIVQRAVFGDVSAADFQPGLAALLGGMRPSGG